ncbi:hypothetical protein [Sphingomonas sp. Leaf4]|uniref:hypothetical protein n=1 Tax=Sphingomonas sp. Leaf4 TaxID=2876553 RepID=UPI001E5574AC|nr:hypothetical protein [Sphingomonas sp. Leaf4]
MPDSTPLLDEMERCTDALDLLIAQGRAAIPSHRLYETMADGARDIARRLDEAARGKPQPATNPPRYLSADGQRGGW